MYMPPMFGKCKTSSFFFEGEKDGFININNKTKQANGPKQSLFGLTTPIHIQIKTIRKEEEKKKEKEKKKKRKEKKFNYPAIQWTRNYTSKKTKQKETKTT